MAAILWRSTRPWCCSTRPVVRRVSRSPGPAIFCSMCGWAAARSAPTIAIPWKVAVAEPEKRLAAVVGGVPIRKFVINGGQQLLLGHIDQDSLDIRINGGGGSVSAQGRVGNLNLVISGHGNANLAGLTARDAKVAIFGHGDATLAPRQSLYLTIVGPGIVRLQTRPLPASRRPSSVRAASSRCSRRRRSGRRQSSRSRLCRRCPRYPQRTRPVFHKAMPEASWLPAMRSGTLAVSRRAM